MAMGREGGLNNFNRHLALSLEGESWVVVDGVFGLGER
jgi:hypothetical protein